jgi:hypothetical protein
MTQLRVMQFSPASPSCLHTRAICYKVAVNNSMKLLSPRVAVSASMSEYGPQLPVPQRPQPVLLSTL